MSITRRQVLSGLGAMIASPTMAQSDKLPNRTVTIVVPFPPGGATDRLGRMLADKLQPLLKQSVIVDNRPGGNGAIASNFVRGRPADGSTLYLVAAGFSTAPATAPAAQNYNPTTDFTPIAKLATNSLVIIANSTTPYSTFPEFIKYASAHPGDATFALSGQGSADHLYLIRLMRRANVKFLLVPYRGEAPSTVALMAGEVQLRLAAYATNRPIVEAGKAKMLVQVTETRSQFLPDLATASETYSGLSMESYFGIIGPAGMNPELTGKLSEMFQQILQMADVKQNFFDYMMDSSYQSPNEFRQFLDENFRANQALVKEIGFSMSEEKKS